MAKRESLLLPQLQVLYEDVSLFPSMSTANEEANMIAERHISESKTKDSDYINLQRPLLFAYDTNKSLKTEEMTPLSREEFNNKILSIVKTFPLPPTDSRAFSAIADDEIPNIVMCEKTIVLLMQELFRNPIESLKEDGTIEQIKRFLFGKPPVCLARYLAFMEEQNFKPPREVSLNMNSVGFSKDALPLNKWFATPIVLTNQTSGKLDVSVYSIPSDTRNTYSIQLSYGVTDTADEKSGVLLGNDEKPLQISLKKGKDEYIQVSFRFNVRSSKMSHLFLLDSPKGREILYVYAVSLPVVFGVEPTSVPCTMVNGYPIPNVLVLLRKKFLSLNGLPEQGIFRVSCDKVEAERSIAFLNRNGDNLTLENIPTSNVHTLAYLIKYFFAKLPVPIMNSIDLDYFKSANVDTDWQAIRSKLPMQSRYLFEWVVDLFASVAFCEGVNKMSPHNCGIVMAPNLLAVDDINLEKSLNSQCISFLSMCIKDRLTDYQT